MLTVCNNFINSLNHVVKVTKDKDLNNNMRDLANEFVQVKSFIEYVS